MKKTRLIIFPFLGLLCFASARTVHAAESAQIARGGKPLVSVVVSNSAEEETRKAAEQLAGMLGRMAGGDPFPVVTGDGTSGLAVGTVADFPEIQTGVAFDPEDPLRRDEYLLRTRARGAWILGASPGAVQYAVWDFLYRLGYRQFFPGPDWEIIPKAPDMQLAVDALEKPDFKVRRLFLQYGSYLPKEYFKDWVVKNRASGDEGFQLSTAHSWAGFLSTHREAFKAHPEWMPVIKGKRYVMDWDAVEANPRGGGKRLPQTLKFCLSHPDLRKLMVEDAIQRFEATGARDSVSMDPSDGSNWCECAECKKMGSVSDQLMTVVNEAAEALTAKYPHAKIGVYAYNQHGIPPTGRVHPAVIVSVATGLTNTGGLTTLEVMEGWKKQGASLGIRDYFTTYAWHRDLPGGGKAPDPAGFGRILRKYKDMGAEFYIGEGADSWAPNGLGYYIALRALWDLGESAHAAELEEDFLDKAFGPAKEPMREYYRQLKGGSARLPVCADMVGRMYRAIQAARPLTSDPAIQKRLNSLALYARYVELYMAFTNADDAQKQQAFEDLIAYALRIRDTGMVHSVAVHRDLPVREKKLTVPEDKKFNMAKNKENPWMHQPAFTQEEMDALVAAGIEANPVASFVPQSFSVDLVPGLALAQASGQENIPPSTEGLFPFGWAHKAHRLPPPTFYVWVPEGKNAVSFLTNAPVQIQLFRPDEYDEPLSEVDRRQAATGEDAPLERVDLASDGDGLRVLRLSKQGGLQWDPGTQFVFNPQLFSLGGAEGGRFYFYVPKGTRIVGGFTREGKRGQILDPAGNPIFSLADLDVGKYGAYFEIPVPSGDDGKFWSVERPSMGFSLSTVPPWLSLSPAQSLLPREVVEADGKAGH